MKTLPRIALGSVAALLVLAISLVLYVLFGDLSVHKDRILAAVSDATGFYIGSEGPFDLDVGREISLSVDNVTIGNPAWPDEHALGTLETFRVVVDTWSVLSGPIEIDSLGISGAHINLKSSTDGGANWIPETGPEEEIDEAAPGPDPLPHQLILDDIRVSFEEDGYTLIISETSKLHMSRLGPTHFNFDLDNKIGETSLAAKGSLHFADDFSDVTSLRLDFDEAAFGQTGSSDISASFSGFMAAELSGEVPSIEADIDMSELRIQSSDEFEAPAEAEEADEGELLFDAAPLAYSWLDSVELDADLTVANATVNRDTLSDVHIAVTVVDGALKIAPFDFSMHEGSFSSSLELAPADGAYALALAADARELRITHLADENQARETVPPLNATLNLTGTGTSMNAIMASSNGSLSGRQGSGQLNFQAANALFSDVLTSILQTLNPMAEEKVYADVECSVFDIDITDGVATIEQLALQSDRVTIVGSGSIKFETEALDLAINTKSREGLGISVGGVANSFVKVGGTLKSPVLGVNALGGIATTGAAISTGGLSVLAKSLWDRVSSEIDLCAQPDSAAED